MWTYAAASKHKFVNRSSRTDCGGTGLSEISPLTSAAKLPNTKKVRASVHELTMSLYYETATILENPDKIGGSFKARIFKKKDLKSKPGQIYALVAEASKWSKVLKDVIEKCAILKEERKVRQPKFNTQRPCMHTWLISITANAHPRPPPHPRPPALQVRRRSTQRSCSSPRYNTAQSTPQC